MEINKIYLVLWHYGIYASKTKQISEEILELLKNIKIKKVHTYDEVTRRLMKLGEYARSLRDYLG